MGWSHFYLPGSCMWGHVRGPGCEGHQHSSFIACEVGALGAPSLGPLRPFQVSPGGGCSGILWGCTDRQLLLELMQLWTPPSEWEAVLTAPLRFRTDPLEMEDGFGMEEPFMENTGMEVLGTKGPSCFFRAHGALSQLGRLRAPGLETSSERL